MINNPRLAAFEAIKTWSKNQKNVEQYFENNSSLNLSAKDKGLAKEIACGVIRRYLSLEYFLEKLFYPRKVLLKPDERILFWMALYQFLYLEKIPLYAIVNETINLAKELRFMHLVGLYNALLRKLDKIDFALPKDRLDIYYSYPQFFIDKLIKEYGLEKTHDLAQVLNIFFPPKVRMDKEENEYPEAYVTDHFKVMTLRKGEDLSFFAENAKFYIQNISPVLLMEFLASDTRAFKSILDLCSSPGGKLLIAHKLYPEASLFANDLTQEKINLLKKNLDKYHVLAKVLKSPAESFTSNEKFDLIIVDAPCSNTGVLHKRPEARWRLNEPNLRQLNDLQFSILTRAESLLNSEGQIWYMTCSILKEENEGLMERVQKELNLKINKTLKILPDAEGKDGGFACCLIKKSQ